MLSNDQTIRYDRQLRLEGFGKRSQERLCDGSVLVVGAGGLGSPALLYLAAAGVGRIGILDNDVVDRSNLQRQVVHRDCDVGTAKVTSAARTIRELNPEVVVEVFDRRLDEGNAREILRHFDVVLDGVDNFPTRYLINDAAYFEGVPVVHGAIYRFEGHATVFARGRGPCYRCLFPQPPAADSVPSCSRAGVLGILPGTIGTVQATEVIKLIAGIGEPLIGRLLNYDALSMRWGEMRLPQDPACPLCGETPTITDVAGVEPYCSNQSESLRPITLPIPPSVPVPGAEVDETEPERLSAAEYRRLCASGEAHLLLDVRERVEVAAGSIPGHLNVPLDELPSRLGELERWKDGLVVCHCRQGGRSLEAARLLRRTGFDRVTSLDGGYLAWRQSG